MPTRKSTFLTNILCRKVSDTFCQFRNTHHPSLRDLLHTNFLSLIPSFLSGSFFASSHPF